MHDLAVLILAAGKGERMCTDRPKVLHPLSGKALLSYSLETAKGLKPKKLVLLTGHKAAAIQKRFAEEKIIWAKQAKQLGTAHAVLCGLESLKSFRGLLFILYGDVPFVQVETLKAMQSLLEREDASLIVLTAEVKDPTGYGRILRDRDGFLSHIVEEKECTEDQKAVNEINSGIYLARIQDISGPLARVKKSILKGEYYLTELVSELNREGKKVLSLKTQDPNEVMGINSQEQLAEADEILQIKIRKKWMSLGVTMIRPESIRIDPEVILESGVTLHPGVILGGKTKIKRDTEILPYSVIESCEVLEGARIGPFAHLRPGSYVGRQAHVGNFVELKKTRLETGAKANHLAYLGDAIVGARSNVGAGTITCNYDGFVKHQTIIGENAFIGSDTQLVAPVRVGKGAWVGAGTTVTKNVPPGALAVSRMEQANIKNWRKKKK